MTRWARFLKRARATFSGRHDRELRDELQLHLQLLEEEYRAQGIGPDAARQRARREFGNATLFQEASHDLFSFRWLEDILQDLRYAAGEARRSVGFTCIAVLSLACGIGAMTTAFTVVDAFLVRDLPVREPDRLVAVSTADSATWGRWTYPAFVRWRESADTPFETAASSDATSYQVPRRGSEKPADVRVSLVSGNYFHVIGVDIALGRGFVNQDQGDLRAAGVAIISDAFWERWFGSAPDVLTKTIELQGVQYDIVGVAPNGFTGHAIGHPSDVWIPIGTLSAPDLVADRWGTGARWLRVIGRLAPGASLEQASAVANLIHQRFVTEKAAALGAANAVVTRERKQTVTTLSAANGFAPERAQYARPLLLLSAITALLLLAACANFTNLMLAQSETRQRELVIRLALGGGRWRLLRQLATECAALAVASGVLGLLFARWATTIALERFAVMIAPVELAVGFDARVLGYAGASVALALACGLWPCTRVARRASVASVHQATSTAGQTPTRAFAGRIVLIAQLALCTVLLIAAGLLLRTVMNLRSQDLGFDRHVLLISLSPGQAGYSDPAAAMLFHRVSERLAVVPGVTAVGISGPSLLDSSNYWVDGSELLTTDRGVVVPGAQWTFAAVGPGFFDAVGLPLLHGRSFDERDANPSSDVIVINQRLASVLFAGESAVGRRLRTSPRGPMLSVVGVVNDLRQISPRDHDTGVVYLPLRDFRRAILAVRTAGPPEGAAAAVTHQLNAIAGDVQIEKTRTIAEVLDEAIAQERLMSAIASVLSSLVITIGCVGLYAVMSYDVARRTRELGIRVALGATSRRVVSMVLRDSAGMVLPALAIGVPVGIAASRPLSSQLYGVQTDDPGTLIAVAVLLAVVALLAALQPAHGFAD